MNKDQCKRDMRHALMAAREVRKYQPYGRCVGKGVTPLHRAAGRMYPQYTSPEGTMDLYWGLIRRAANRRQEILHHPGGLWVTAGRTSDGRVIYAAPAGTKVHQ